MNTALLLAVFLSFSTYALAQNIECFNCGYREDADGHRSKIPDEYEDVPFCGTDNLSNSTAPHKGVFPVSSSSEHYSNCYKLVFIIQYITAVNVAQTDQIFCREVAALHSKSKR